ncbi:MAG: protein TolQ [Candidatus Obscuribacterales bacterium]|nr:protein TolQ [Steroidobacteraceae bacterium]
MTGEMSIVQLVLSASIMVQVVLVLLLFASVASWAVIFAKRSELKKWRVSAERFEESFWSGGDLTAMYRAIEARREKTQGMESVFESGFREFARLRTQQGITSEQLMEGSRRAMRIALLKETDRLEHNIGMLATTGSISPYIGLFGTVWGIMAAFQGLSNVQQATISMVAPHISEALIATAMGLFAAIPATMAYNRYAEQVTRLELRLDTFVEELSTILQRHASARPAMPSPTATGSMPATPITK